MKKLSLHIVNKYKITEDFDADDIVRRRWDMDKHYYFSLHKGYIYELDLELNYNKDVFHDSISVYIL